ncbi:uncharacterized protein HKW66_Vig0148020 [Vigna angularis]|uniref:Uncharacterized protein n=1 Tax=Phaseolus angularis TaxID=3914 RepID=A0A8T0JV66_PHAAN|nr:uncharacterized protein HKW66_Vig0148020 [Vigna angularis]
MGKERLNEEKELKMEKFGVKGWCRSWNGKGVSGYWFGVLGYAEHREKLYLGIRLRRNLFGYKVGFCVLFEALKSRFQQPSSLFPACHRRCSGCMRVKELSRLWTYVKVVEFGEVAWR